MTTGYIYGEAGGNHVSPLQKILFEQETEHKEINFFVITQGYNLTYH